MKDIKKTSPLPRIVIETLIPSVDGGRFPAKASLGNPVEIRAVIICDGHEHLKAKVQLWYVSLNKTKGKVERGAPDHELRLTDLGNDIWGAQFTPEKLGFYQFTVIAEIDHFENWASTLRKRLDANQEFLNDLIIGRTLLLKTLKAVESEMDRNVITTAGQKLKNFSEKSQGSTEDTERIKLELHNILNNLQLRNIMLGTSDKKSRVIFEERRILRVDPEIAEFSSWYEFFPRSCVSKTGEHGTFKSSEKRLEYLADLGFNVAYLPPIHPTGTAFKKGKNNSLEARANDVGSPWAIGSKDGGHDALHPRLGNWDDFKNFLKKAQSLGIHVAMDMALQVSPDHPYVTENPEWFKKKPDGTIQYAENPPKKYQDIYPFYFETKEWKSLWQELHRVFEFWIKKGVRIFRVDNPHTKPFEFWEWLITELQSVYPDVVFLSEAFTRPHILKRLAKLGFTQSYTYFTWREKKAEWIQYMNELYSPETVYYLRPNFWPNTPDILPLHLQTGKREAFIQRLILASTLSPSFGVYGPAYELMEHKPLESKEPGKRSEEYLNSEKYEIRLWDINSKESLAPVFKLINRIRKENKALQAREGFAWLEIPNDQILAYSKFKKTNEGANIILVVVSLDFQNMQSGFLKLPLDKWGIGTDKTFKVRDLFNQEKVYEWKGWDNYVELDPQKTLAHIFRVEV